MANSEEIDYHGNPGGITTEMDYLLACAALNAYHHALIHKDAVGAGGFVYFSDQALGRIVQVLEAATEEWRTSRS